MKKAISEYIEFDEREKKQIWKKAIFVFDTNVFLNIYRYSKKTRESMLEAMDSLKDRIWMPYQVAKEFMKNRPTVIFETIEQYSKLEEEKNKFVKTVGQALLLKETDDEVAELSTFISKWIDNKRKENLLVDKLEKDDILQHILSIFDGKVGIPESDIELEELCREAKSRYEKQVPPGYKDAKKENESISSNAYGDYIIWTEIMNYSKATGKDIIFVTHDQKEDWWNIVKGKTIGPRIELRKEFEEKTGRQFHMYNMNTFIEQFKNSKEATIDQSVVDEMVALQKQLYDAKLKIDNRASNNIFSNNLDEEASHRGPTMDSQLMNNPAETSMPSFMKLPEDYFSDYSRSRKKNRGYFDYAGDGYED